MNSDEKQGSERPETRQGWEPFPPVPTNEQVKTFQENLSRTHRIPFKRRDEGSERGPSVEEALLDGIWHPKLSGLTALDRRVIEEAFMALCGYLRELAWINVPVITSVPLETRIKTAWSHTIRRLEEIFGQWHGAVGAGLRPGAPEPIHCQTCGNDFDFTGQVCPKKCPGCGGQVSYGAKAVNTIRERTR